MKERSEDEWEKRSQRWVLVVDDEESIRSYVGQYLFHSGFQVTLCKDGLSALQVTQNFTNVMLEIQNKTLTSSITDMTSIHSRLGGDDDNDDHRPIILKTCPDAIVTDIRMPGPLDGLGLLREIRADENLKGIPIILLTAKGRIEDRVLGYDSGADVYLPKPFDPDELVAILDNVIDRNQQLSRTRNDGSSSKVTLQDVQKDVQEIKEMILRNQSTRTGLHKIIIQNIDEDDKDESKWSSSLLSTSNSATIVSGNISLSSDEYTVLKLLCQGLTNKEMAQQLNYSIRRVEQHLTSMYRKTGCNNRTELVRWAFGTKMVDI